jgi:DNA-binding transcriptional ArsR family regulator
VSDRDRRKKIFRALNHDFRKKILEKVSEERVTYTELLNMTGVESGYLAYHLRSMTDLLQKGEDGYTLTSLGVEAISMLHGRVDVPKREYNLPRITALTLALIIIVSGIYIVNSILNPTQDLNDERDERRQILFNHTIETMDLIVGAFEYVDIPRSYWADILLKTALLRQDLETLQTYNDTIVSTPLIHTVDHFLSEATRTLSGTDAAYLTLSRENRQLLRDLHYSLFTLKQSLE